MYAIDLLSSCATRSALSMFETLAGHGCQGQPTTHRVHNGEQAGIEPHVDGSMWEYSVACGVYGAGIHGSGTQQGC